MNCFNHIDIPAVGLCKSCRKGLCSDCIHDLKRGVACKSACKDDVVKLLEAFDKRKAFHAKLPSGTRQLSIFSLLLGALFISMSVLDDFSPIGLLGLLYVIFGLSLLGRSMRRVRVKKSNV